MKKLISLLVLAACFSAFATPVNITVVGPIAVSTWNGDPVPPFNTNVPPGDNQVLPDNLLGNNWDMEAVILDGSKLSLVASYDWMNGVPSDAVTTGDLFLAVNGDTKYDYALRFNFGTDNYDVYKIVSGTTFNSVNDGKNGLLANPFTVVAGSANDLGDHAFLYTTGLSDNAALGYTSWPGYGKTTHNEITLNLADFLSLTAGEEIATHITMTCGNDELNGHGRIPEPGSLSMILVGLLSLGGLALSRKRK